MITVAKPTTPSPGFDSDNTNAQVSQLNGNVNVAGNKRVGPSIVLKVMAGDTVSITTYAWYAGATQGPATGVPPIAVFTALIIWLMISSLRVSDMRNCGATSWADRGPGHRWKMF